MKRNPFLLALIPAALASALAAHFVLRLDEATAAATPPPAMAAAPVAALPAASPQPAADAVVPGSAAESFRLVDGRVDAHLRDARLPATVARIAAAAAVELVGAERLADVPLRLDLDGVPAAEALLRLTAGYNSAFEYRGARLVRMIIAPEPASHADDAQQAAANLDQADPQQRGDAVETIALHGGDRAREVVARALGDADEEVRLRALEQTQVVQGLALPADTLRDLLLRDASETVRIKVLDVLATNPAFDAATLAGIARNAEADRSELVRSRAAELREQLETPRQP
jgi:hypothetical protein